MRALEVWLPGRVPSPNQLPRHHMVKHRVTQAMTRRAFLAGWSALNAARMGTFVKPARVRFEMRRVRLLDEGDNRESACKYFRDGLTRLRKRHGRSYVEIPGILPLGDGPTSPYKFDVIQIRVSTPKEEGVLVIIEEMP